MLNLNAHGCVALQCSTGRGCCISRPNKGKAYFTNQQRPVE